MRGNHAEQTKAILARAKALKDLVGHCPVEGCSGSCHGFIYTTEAHRIAINHTARMRGLRLAGWVYECIPQADKNNIFHFLYHNAQQQEMLAPRMVERLVGEINPGLELYEVVPA